MNNNDTKILAASYGHYIRNLLCRIDYNLLKLENSVDGSSEEVEKLKFLSREIDKVVDQLSDYESLDRMPYCENVKIFKL
jgi:hypothetical protein